MTKILFIARVRVCSSDGPLLLLKSFKALGCDVELLSVSHDLTFVERVLENYGRGNGKLSFMVFNKRLYHLALTYEPDLLFVYGSNWNIFPETLHKIKQRTGCQIAIWELNQSFWRAHQAESLALYDHLFALDSYVMPLVKIGGAKHVHHLPACCDPGEHKVISLSPEEKVQLGADLCFIGSAHADRIALFQQLVDYDFKIWGWTWINLSPSLQACVCTEPVYGLKKTKIYNASKIVLNFHGPHMVDGENFRVFEVAACGGFSLSGYKKDLSKCFRIGEEMITFEDADDMRNKIAYYLCHEDERKEVAARARARVLAEHTYRHRAEHILDAIFAQRNRGKPGRDYGLRASGRQVQQ
jgi:spore maturation protein CgeB